jgi:hypothetical protein
MSLNSSPELHYASNGAKSCWCLASRRKVRPYSSLLDSWVDGFARNSFTAASSEALLGTPLYIFFPSSTALVLPSRTFLWALAYHIKYTYEPCRQHYLYRYANMVSSSLRVYVSAGEQHSGRRGVYSAARLQPASCCQVTCWLSNLRKRERFQLVSVILPSVPCSHRL